jgi:hypothetical protein
MRCPLRHAARALLSHFVILPVGIFQFGNLEFGKTTQQQRGSRYRASKAG